MKIKVHCDYCNDKEVEVGYYLFQSLDDGIYSSYHLKDEFLGVEIRICAVCLKKALDAIMNIINLQGGKLITTNINLIDVKNKGGEERMLHLLSKV